MATRAPVDGRANQPIAQDLLPPDADPALLTRKGYLYILADKRADSAWLAEIRAQYYNDTSFDILPSLQRALTAVYRTWPQARESVSLLLVLQGLDIFAVGTDTGAIWLVRFDEVKQLLPNAREARLLDTLLPTGDGIPACNLYGLQQRLSTGDAVVMATQPGAERLTDAIIRRTLRRTEALEKVAGTLAKVASRHSNLPVPVTIIHVSGFTPIPDIGPAQKWKVAERPPIKTTSRGVSPIVPALVVAACAIAFSLWFTGTTISKESLIQLVGWMLTPVPTVTPAGGEATPAPSETPSPTSSIEARASLPPVPTAMPSPAPGRSLLQIFARPTATPPPPKQYPLPELMSPASNEKLAGQEVVLRWAWAGALEEDEYFDVRLWREGTPEKSIAWTKERTYTERSLASGWYNWRVVVIRGHDGVIEQKLSEEPRPLSFYLREGPPPTVTPTATITTPPTRTTPVTQPTRG